jgi:hypothetical protein
MLSVLLLAFAAPAPAALAAPQAPIPREVPMRREFVGPTPGENHWLSMPHRNSDDRMFPDIAIGELRVDGDTLYVKVINNGQSEARGPILIAARALANGAQSGVVQTRTGKLEPGQSRWVTLSGFSVKTAATTPSLFALQNATAVSAVAKLVPSSAGALDRSGQGCGECTREMDETNNSLTAEGSRLKHGRPQ